MGNQRVARAHGERLTVEAGRHEALLLEARRMGYSRISETDPRGP